MSIENHPEKLIKEIYTFLEKERELYGDFNIEPVDNEKNSTIILPEKEKPYFPSGIDNPPKIYSALASCSTLEELEQLCEEAEVLKTDLPDTRMVFGGGNPTADLMLIGEAPGAEENKTGKPFVGRAGKLLDKILKAINFSRDDIYIGNILKHRPPDNRNPLADERMQSLPFLFRQIDLVQPKLILAMGKISAQTLLQSSESLTNMRGTFHPFRDSMLLVTYHPAALLRNPNWKRPVWEDVQQLRKRYDELGARP